MSRILYLDAPTGLAGDMLFSALVEAGANIESISRSLRGLGLPPWRISLSMVQRGGLAAQLLDIEYSEERQHRHWPQIVAMIAGAGFGVRARELALAAFEQLARAEAAAHGCTMEEVHFHEVGAADSLLDICGVALAVEQLAIDAVYIGDLPLQRGYVDCAHGRLPLPAPATARLLDGYRLRDNGVEGEQITPTGAALLKALGARQEPPPPFVQLALGRGAGHKQLPQPNILRAVLGEVGGSAGYSADEVDVLETNIDDCGGELLAALWDRAFAAGALDISYTPCMMKKQRPAYALCVLAPPCCTEAVIAAIFAETTAIGLRIRRERRIVQPRRSVAVATAYGEIRVKLSGNNIAPEYDDCAAAAARHGVSVKQVYQAACAGLAAVGEEQ
ncbi:MAG: nickel pincer cofactor biosynthesis protein LarC [Bacillota bacterium]|nr:nickel pincer cofactor biosynthesis protein LarC [Bacillota bacterium]